MKPDLEAIKGRLEAAEGPWKYEGMIGDLGKPLRHYATNNKGKIILFSEDFNADYAGLDKPLRQAAQFWSDISTLLEWCEKLEAVRAAVNQYLEVYESSGEYHDWRIRELAALDKLYEEVIDD